MHIRPRQSKALIRTRITFGAFASLLGAEPRKYGFARSAQHSEPTLHLGWVQGEAKYLQS
jgi:hypothetical protein